MSGPVHPEATGRPRMAAEQVAGRGFMVVRRGYDPDEVRGFLEQVAAELRSLHAQIEALEEAAAVAPSADAAGPPAAPPLPTDEEELVALVGDETAAVLRTARSAATEMRRKAEAEAERVVDAARVAASSMREEAEIVLAAAASEAERKAAVVLQAARNEAEALIERARGDGDVLREQAEQQRRLTIEGAQGMREKILADLSRRRRVATVQIEQLRAGRERLLESYAVVRRTLEEVHDELQRADAEARAAADEAGRLASGGEPAELGEGSGETAQAAGPVELPAVPAVPPVPAQSREVNAPPTTEVVDDAGAPGAAEGERQGGGEGGADVAWSGSGHNEPAGEQAATPPPAGDDLERVRILRPPSGSVTPRPRADAGRGGPPSLRAVPGGRMAAGGAAEVRIVPAAVPEEDATDVETPVGTNVDELFARIRSGRQASVAAAREVLDSPADADAEAPPAEAEKADAAGDERPQAARSDEDEAALQGRDVAVGEHEAALVRRLKRALQDDQNELLDRLRGTRGTLKAATLLPDHATHLGRLTAAAREQLDAVAAAGAEFGGGAAPAGLAAALAEGLAEGLVVPLRRRIGDVVAEHGGDDQAVVVEALGALYREWKTQRVEPAALDAVVMAFAVGSVKAMPAGTRVRWVVEDAGGPCADCDDNALAGYLTVGDAFPTGQSHPPAHVGCRCLLVPAP